MPWKRVRLRIGIVVILIGGLLPVFSKEFFASGPTAGHLVIYSGGLILAGLVLVLLDRKAEK